MTVPRPGDRLAGRAGADTATAAAPVGESFDPSPAGDVTGSFALVVEHLTKRFGDRVAVDDVSFRVGCGEVFGFLGPNGAGKSTTVRTLGTLLVPSSGTAVIAGIPLTPTGGQAIRSRIAIMPESPGLYLRLSVTENLRCFAGLYALPDPAARIRAVLQAVSLADRANDLCKSLSKGLRQRVALARALLPDPTVLFLDEPTSGLDPVAAHDVHELITRLRDRGVTVFLTTHQLDEADRLCDRVAILNTTLRMVGRPDELRARLFARSLAVHLRTPLDRPDDLFTGVTGVRTWQCTEPSHYVLDVADPTAAAPEVARALIAAGADLESLTETRRSLQDVYLQLISEDVEANRP